jgi:hypothetical protein
LSKPRILDVAIDTRANWAKKHLASIRQAYAAAPFGKQYVPALEEVLTRSWDRIVDLDLALTGLMAEWLGVRPRIERASALGIDGGQSDRLVNICRHFGATRYLSGSAAREYLDVALFARNDIAVEWQDFAHPVYPQLHGEFVPYLSAVDLILNCGAESRAVLEGASHVG